MLKPGFAIRDNTSSESEGNESRDTLLDVSAEDVDLCMIRDKWIYLLSRGALSYKLVLDL
jgi:hypothetical protein